jgi:peptidoglycan/LPS O-acetylase OafA/YrhL
VGFSLLLSTTWLPASYEGLTTSPWRCVYWGIPSALIVTGFAGGNQELTRSALVFLGDASYSTYLTHNFILGIFQRFVFRRPSFLPCLYADLEIIAVCLITILLTLPAYLCIERPLTSWLQSLTSPKRALLLARRS